MRIHEVYGHIIPKSLRVQSITLYPYIFYATQNPSRRLRTHEYVHIHQILELGPIRFYISYAKDFLKGLIITGSWKIAYLGIRYEVEAYTLESDPTLLEKIQNGEVNG